MREEGGGGGGRGETLYHTMDFASSNVRCVDTDRWTSTAGVEAGVGQQPQSGADTRGFNKSVMSEASGWVPMRAYLVARRVSEKEECLVRTLRNWQISFSPR